MLCFPRMRNYFDRDELRRFFEAVRLGGSKRDAALFRLSYSKGLRASEPGLLLLEETELRQRPGLCPYVTLHRLKGSYSGRSALGKSDVRALRAWVRERGRKAGPLFRSRSGAGLSRQQLDRLMRRYAAAADLAPHLAQFRTLKRSCATHLSQAGVELLEVNRTLGHVSLQNTVRHVGRFDPTGAATAAQLDAFLSSR